MELGEKRKEKKENNKSINNIIKLNICEDIRICTESY
jgi:hypothetical protein